jgi:DNA-nicking Smr family endonuclease
MSRRRLSDDERALWRGVARGVTPLRRSASAPLGVAPDQVKAGTPPPAQSVPKERTHAKQPPALAPGSIFTA